MTGEDARGVRSSPVSEIDPFVQELLGCCPMIRSIWLIGTVAGNLAAARPYAWDLVAFADTLTLYRLRKAVKLHRADVRLRVLTYDERLETAWGGPERHHALLARDWQQTARCLWQGIDPTKAARS